MVLFTPYYSAVSPERQHELDECVARNLACGALTRVVLLVDDGREPPLTDPRLEVLPVQGRPTYRTWVDLSASLPLGTLSVLANSDIYFDETIHRLPEAVPSAGTFMALTRCDRIKGALIPHPNPHWSQDAWAYRVGSEISASLLKSLEVPLGVPRCDNKVAYLFAIHGWRLVNPLKFVQGIHLHETGQRNYDKKTDLTVMGGVAYVHPGLTLESAAEIDIDIWARGLTAIRQVGLNRSLDAWAREAADEIVTSSDPVAPVLDQHAGGLRNAPAAEPKDPLRGERVVYQHLHRFRVQEDKEGWFCQDLLLPGPGRRVAASSRPAGVLTTLPVELLAAFIPLVVDIEPLAIVDRPRSTEDCHFWQYPAATERQAHLNHLLMDSTSHVDVQQRRIHTYLGLPWATYIDRKTYPQDVVAWLRPRLLGLQLLAEANGFELAVHTVCQQIHWRRFLEHFVALGITDLHLSHAEKHLDPAREGWPLRLHSWPLMAVNVEDPTRSAGLMPGRPAGERRYLASFIGAHMRHYRSSVRLRLREAAERSRRKDVLVEVGDEWHFNPIVYTEQVGRQAIAETEARRHEAATRRYNEALTDSVFSLCPEGAGPNTLRVWESLAVGAIPVILADGWLPPSTDCGPGLADCCLFVSEAEIDGLFDRLASMPVERLSQMQADCRRTYAAMRHRVCFP